jgi:hypothetical protein
MNALTRIGLLGLLVSSALAHADPGPLTREQVRSELLEARRTGEFRTYGEAGVPLRNLNPGLYPPQQPAQAGRARAEVVDELLEAKRNGEIATGEAGLPEYELRPSAYPVHPKPPGKTRAEVRAERDDAIRNGDLSVPGETGLTYRQLNPGAYPRSR